jgi:hypothetical protein
MSFLTRVRMAIVRWWIRNSELQERARFEDLEGLGRTLACPPLRNADDEAAAVSPSVPVKREARFPNRLIIRFE